MACWKNFAVDRPRPARQETARFPAKAGIQFFWNYEQLDSGFRRNDGPAHSRFHRMPTIIRK
jgi:hypothetical protein